MKTRIMHSGAVIGIIAVGALLFLVIAALLFLEESSLLKTADPQTGEAQDWPDIPDPDPNINVKAQEQVCPFPSPPAVGGIRSDDTRLAQIPICFNGAIAPEPNNHVIQITVDKEEDDPGAACKRRNGDIDCPIEDVIKIVCAVGYTASIVAPGECKAGASACVVPHLQAIQFPKLQGIVQRERDASTDQFVYRFWNPANIIVNNAPRFVPAVYPIAPKDEKGNTKLMEGWLTIYTWSINKYLPNIKQEAHGLLTSVIEESLAHERVHTQITKYFIENPSHPLGIQFSMNNPPIPGIAESFTSVGDAEKRVNELFLERWTASKDLLDKCHEAFHKIVRDTNAPIPGYPDLRGCFYDPDYSTYPAKISQLLATNCGAIDREPAPRPSLLPRLPSTSSQPTSNSFFPTPTRYEDLNYSTAPTPKPDRTRSRRGR